MSVLELFVLSAALGTDLFSVAVPIGMNRVRLRVIVRSAAVFALFHIIMILTGYYVGHWLGSVVEHVSTYHIDLPAATVQNWASALGALVLAGLGLHMIKENLAGGDAVDSVSHPLQGLTLVMLAVSVSIDALAAGFSLGMMDVDLIKLSIILGAVIFAIAVFGLGLGRRVGSFIGERAAAIGGAVLIALGLHVLWTALW
ncbi:manganese efflux pump MntP family protein [Sporolituus thermophilus]|uniref:Mn2+ efflux pump MntP n=1 Tax=Sporolituus thermophilus DSM 23256 TaxID=1123285 RepID=A0A1G7HJR7_9FIRM|nr:Putative Mn2+ efflux pump MntP [Sporolituus thermophilus DSM 23256]